MQFMCSNCNHKWTSTPGAAFIRKNCSKCIGNEERLLKAHETFVKKVKKANPFFQITGKYIHPSEQVEFNCLKCGSHGIKSTPGSLVAGMGCRTCGLKSSSDSKRLTHKEFIDRVKISQPNVTVLEQYKEFHARIKCRCEECGGIWSPPGSHVSSPKGTGCPACANSGFNPAKPATFYVLEIIYLGAIYYGFGISGDLEIRLYRHKKNIELAGARLLRTILYDFDIGHEARELERDIKSDPTIPTKDVLLIDGFRREAIHERDLSKLLDKIEKHRHWNAVTC